MYKKFYLNIFILALISFVLIGSFNFIIDPYGLFRNFEKVGINQQKEGVRNKIRYVKSIQVLTQNPKTLIIASSRVHDGVNPESAMIPKTYKPVYNYGIPMIRIKEVKLFLLHALKSHNVKNVIIGLDFFMFNSKEKLNHELDPKIFDNKFQMLNLYIKPLISATALNDSIQTIKISHAYKDRKEFFANGYRPGSQVNFGLKNYEKLHNYMNWTFLSSRQTETLYYENYGLDEEVFSDFKEVIAICKKNHINLILYISPAHANLDGEGIVVSKNFALFEEWKRKITKISDDMKIPLWDFSGYNSITTEAVKTPMKNYWDSSHFTEKIGDLILAKILNNKDYISTVPISFGVKLTPETIESHLHQIKLDRQLYLKSNFHEINDLHSMYIKALNGAKQDPKEIEGMF